MPALAVVNLTDAAATPVVHAFTPQSLTGNMAQYADLSGGIAVGYPKLTITVIPPSKTSRLNKVRMKLVLPVLETISNSTFSGIAPAPTRAYDMTAEGLFFCPERSTLQNRKDIRAMFLDLIGEALTTSLIETQEALY